ncbi:MAG: hypothetical protein Q7J07_01275, partial [Pelolinea sp.]|nr:hypothetical protein [Pelolinea sp.]
MMIVNFGWILISRLPIGKISFYNIFIEGRQRFPFGENPLRSYNLSLYDLNAMFASHIIDDKSQEKSDNLKVILIGDSSIWGYLQEPDQTLTGLLTREFSKRGENITFYNLGYPSISILKDLMIIENSKKYKPDLIIWFTTLEALPNKTQLDISIVNNNPDVVNQLIEKYVLKDTLRLSENALRDTFWNDRRNISDIFDLQIYGILWNATGIDQEYPDTYQTAQRDFDEPMDAFHGITPRNKLVDYLDLEIINNGIEKNPDIDFILINEPILISEGINSSLQYNFYYPIWAYDQYRIIMDDFTEKNLITYYDLWDMVPQNEFTNSAIHLSDS